MKVSIIARQWEWTGEHSMGKTSRSLDLWMEKWKESRIMPRFPNWTNKWIITISQVRACGRTHQRGYADGNAYGVLNGLFLGRFFFSFFFEGWEWEILPLLAPDPVNCVKYCSVWDLWVIYLLIIKSSFVCQRSWHFEIKLGSILCLNRRMASKVTNHPCSCRNLGSFFKLSLLG